MTNEKFTQSLESQNFFNTFFQEEVGDPIDRQQDVPKKRTERSMPYGFHLILLTSNSNEISCLRHSNYPELLSIRDVGQFIKNINLQRILSEK